MEEKISPFVETHKPWIIRKAIADYLRAKNMFANMDRERSSKHKVIFENLKKLTDLTYNIKEDLHLIFKRLIDPKNRIFEESDKYTPNQHETEFINNVGLLFHKLMVARELHYVMEHYAVDSEDFQESFESFEAYWQRILSLFKDGIDLIKLMLKGYSNNIVIMSYLIENDHYVQESFGEKTMTLLERIFGKDKLDQTYVYVGEYCIKSGWEDRARKVLGDALKLNPHNEQANRLMDAIT